MQQSEGTKTLEVGDFLYTHHHNYGSVYYTKYRVQEVTDSYALLNDNTKLKLTTTTNIFRTYRKSPTDYLQATETLDKKYQEQCHKAKVERFWNELSDTITFEQKEEIFYKYNICIF